MNYDYIVVGGEIKAGMIRYNSRKYRFISRRIDDGREEEIEPYLAGCPTCSQQLAELERDEPESFFMGVQIVRYDD